MSKLRELAEWQQCMIRIPGVCNHDPATTVLAHYRMAGICGTGQKPPDECGAWACSACHDVVDGRRQLPKSLYYGADPTPLYFAEAVIRTLHELHKLGYSMSKKK